MFNSWNNCGCTSNNNQGNNYDYECGKKYFEHNKQNSGCGCQEKCPDYNKPSCKTIKICSWDNEFGKKYEY